MDLFERQEKLINNYNKEKEDLGNKKEKLWAGKNISKWELAYNSFERGDQVQGVNDKKYALDKMGSQDTKKMKDLGDIIGYYYDKNNENFACYKKFLCGELNKMMERLSEGLGDSINDELGIWTNGHGNIL